MKSDKTIDIESLIKRITIAFEGQQLGNGVSWREANVLDDYGTQAERDEARALDEKNDWTKIPDTLIEDLRYQCVMPFVDTKGLCYYLPVIMIYSLKKYKTSQSLIIDSLFYSLRRKKVAFDLKKELNASQIQCAIDFIQICLTIGDDYFDLDKVEESLEKYWL